MDSLYKVDITKPPISPPCRIFKGWFASKETKESRKRGKAWSKYIRLYDKALEEGYQDD